MHIFAEGLQPATRHVVDLGTFKVIEDLAIRTYIPDRRVFRIKPAARVWVSCCRRRRVARNCVTQVYYDMQVFWCRQGRGCKA